MKGIIDGFIYKFGHPVMPCEANKLSGSRVLGLTGPELIQVPCIFGVDWNTLTV